MVAAVLLGGSAGVTAALVGDEEQSDGGFVSEHAPNAPALAFQAQTRRSCLLRVPLNRRSYHRLRAGQRPPRRHARLRRAERLKRLRRPRRAQPRRISLYSMFCPEQTLLRRPMAGQWRSGKAFRSRRNSHRDSGQRTPSATCSTAADRPSRSKISNRDPLGPPAGTEGDGPPPLAASVSITWYNGTGIIQFGDVQGKRVEQLAVDSSAGLGASFERWDQALENGQHRDLVWIRGQNVVTGSGYIHVSGLIGDSANGAAVAALIGAVRSLEVVR